MKSFRVLLICFLVGIGCLTGVLVHAHLARADNDGKDIAAVPAVPGRFQILLPRKDYEDDRTRLLDTATGKLYILERRAKPKDKEPLYDWVLIAEAPK